MFKALKTQARAFLKSELIGPVTIGIGLDAAGPRLEQLYQRLQKALPEHGIALQVYCSAAVVPDVVIPEGITLVTTNEPEKAMIADLASHRVSGIVRGQGSSSKFLQEMKDKFAIDRLYRCALLATRGNYQFFFSPVGIDEGNDFDDKRAFVVLISALLSKLGIVPSFYLLSAGRVDDAGRDPRIKASIEGTAALVDELKAGDEQLSIVHGEILIENAEASGANVIIAPDGVSGNLIYRTLIHLGEGHSYGAYYLNPELPGPVMDTSRVGPIEEYVGAIVLAARLLAKP
jgi:predicted methyltransferase MtxX (methanogen marker protein 4)